jgi:hypothetical protein
MISAPIREPPTASPGESVRARPSPKPTAHIWIGAAWALVIAVVPLLVISIVSMFWAAGPLSFTIATLVLLLILVVTAALALLTDRLIRSIPAFYKAAVAVTFTVVMTGFFVQLISLSSWRTPPARMRVYHSVILPCFSRNLKRV